MDRYTEHNGDELTPVVLSQPIKVKPLNIPLIETDHYFIYDILYYLVCEWLLEKSQRGNVYCEISNSLYDYIESILEPVDIESLHLVAEYIIKEAGKIIDYDEFKFLTNMKEVDHVSYRYTDTEKYVRFYVTIRQFGPAC